jgi:hypothetical protein
MERYPIFRNGTKTLISDSDLYIDQVDDRRQLERPIFCRGNNYLIAGMSCRQYYRAVISASRQILTRFHEIWVQKGIISNALIGCKHFPENTVIADGLVKSRNRACARLHAHTHTHTQAHTHAGIHSRQGRYYDTSTPRAETVKRVLINVT